MNTLPLFASPSAQITSATPIETTDANEACVSAAHVSTRSREINPELLKHPGIFRIGDISQVNDGYVSSGFAALDEALNGGWPVARLTEVLCDRVGIGEFSLLLPALPSRAKRSDEITSHGVRAAKTPDTKTAARETRRALFVSQIALPSHLPNVAYAPALESAGVDLNALAFVSTASAQQTLWAVEQTLLSNTAHAVFAWIDEHPHDFALRRISQVARKSQSLCFLMRPRAAETRASPAELRIAVSPAPCAESRGTIALKLLKRRGLLHETTLQLNTRNLACLAAHRTPILLPPMLTKTAPQKYSPLAQATLSPALHSKPKIRERSFHMDR